MPDVALRIGGDEHRGWTSVRIQRSLDQLADTFKLALTDRWEDSAEPRPIRVGEPAELTIDGEPVVTGYVDEALPEYDAEQHSVSVTGRSKTADLVDCSQKERTFKGQTLTQIAKKVADPFGIDVVAEADVGDPFDKMVLEEGQPYHELLDELARIRAVRLTTDARGRLVIARTASARVATSLVLGENIRTASGRFSMRERFSSYTVLGQDKGRDGGWGESVAEAEGVAIDPEVPRHRPTVQLAEAKVDTKTAEKRAKWRRNTALGRSRGLTYTVDGWRHADGLWRVNARVPVRDRWMGIDEEMLIASVQLILDGEGQRSEIRVVPPEAYALIERPEPAPADSGGWG